jgi:hypothetical protein
MPPKSPESSPEKNDTRGLLGGLKHRVECFLQDEKQEVKDKLDILFDGEKPNTERNKSFLFFRNKFFPEGIENGKPVHLQMDWAKDVDTRLNAILERRGIAYFVPDVSAHVMYNGKVFTEDPAKKGYWHKEEMLPLAHKMEITFYEEFPEQNAQQQQTDIMSSKEEANAIPHEGIPKSAQRLRREFLIRNSGEVRQMPRGGTISKLFRGSYPKKVFHVDSQGNTTKKEPRNIDIGDYVWKREKEGEETIFYYSNDAANYNLKIDFPEYSEDIPGVLQKKANATRDLASTYMLLQDPNRFQNVDTEKKAKYQSTYRHFFDLLDASLRSLEQDKTLYHLSPNEFDELCTEVRREISRSMFAQMPGDDFHFLREAVKDDLKLSEDGVDKEISTYMGTHTKPFERQPDFHKEPDIAQAIKEAAEATGIPIQWIVEVIIIESQGDRFAYSGKAFGLMGLRHWVFKGYPENRDRLSFPKTINPMNASESILRGAQYLAALSKAIEESDWYNEQTLEERKKQMIFHAYNRGWSGLQKALRKAEGTGRDYTEHIPDETKGYMSELENWEEELPKILQYLNK